MESNSIQEDEYRLFEVTHPDIQIFPPNPLKSMKQDHTIICECSSCEHQIIISKFDDEEEVYVMIHLTKKSFWRRIKHGVKYIFGYQCRYGAFDEIITTKEKLQQIINNI